MIELCQLLTSQSEEKEKGLTALELEQKPLEGEGFFLEEERKGDGNYRFKFYAPLEVLGRKNFKEIFSARH